MGFFTNLSMSDLTHTQVTQAMKSSPLSRVEYKYRPWWQIVKEHNAKPRTVTLKKNGKVVNVLEIKPW